MKKNLIHPYTYFGRERPLRKVKFCTENWAFSFFLKFGLACRKMEASQGFWYQGVWADILIRNGPLPHLHKQFPISQNFPAVPPPKLGPPLKKLYFGILLERAINHGNFVFLQTT